MHFVGFGSAASRCGQKTNIFAASGVPWDEVELVVQGTAFTISVARTAESGGNGLSGQCHIIKKSTGKLALPWPTFGIREDFAKLPVLTRAEVNANLQRLCSTEYRGQFLPHATGGSSGTLTAL